MSIMKTYTKNSNPTKLLGSFFGNNNSEQDTSKVVMDPSIEQTRADMEATFRLNYASELRSKKQQINDINRGFNELDDEMRGVRQQMMRTPGRKGEIIKEEEISKEFARRYLDDAKQKSSS